MNIIIDNFDFWNMAAQKYYSFPKTYDTEKRKSEAKNLATSGNYLGSRKMDGAWNMIIRDLDGNFHMRSRTPGVNGGFVDKAEWVPHICKELDSIPNGTVLLGEIYFPNNEGSRKITSVLNCLKDKCLERQKTGGYLHYYIFDVLAYKGKNIMNEPFEKRIKTYLDYELLDVLKGNYIEAAEYKEGQELWDLYGEVIAAGGEGIVITKKSAPYSPGKRTARMTLKMKKELTDTIDVFLTGNYKLAVREYKGKTPLETYSYWENIKTGEIFNTNKYNEYVQGFPVEPVSRHYALKYAGSVEIALMKDGKILPVGYVSGITDDMRKEIITNPNKFKGKVFELNCMEIEFTDSSANGFSFRHPKFVGERKDKNYLDCDISQIIEK